MKPLDSVRRAGLLVAALAIAACSATPGASGPPVASPAAELGNPSTDKLAQILARGTLRLATDPAYPPASFAVEGAQRANATRCATDELTAPEVDGYDVATSKLIAEGLGVEACFVVPTWSELISGNWNDRWDIAFASIGITRERMGDLIFTRPYYATPERFYVATNASATQLEELSGRRIGVCTGCFADLYLQKHLDLPGEQVAFRVDDATIVGYAVERAGLQEVSDGTLDAFLCQETAGRQAIDDGLALRALDPAPYTAFPAGATDRASGKDLKAFLALVDEILAARFEDGALKALSIGFFGVDYASEAATFDMALSGQVVP